MVRSDSPTNFISVEPIPSRLKFYRLTTKFITGVRTDQLADQQQSNACRFPNSRSSQHRIKAWALRQQDEEHSAENDVADGEL